MLFLNTHSLFPQREATNYQFDFLKPTHISHKYFSQLVEQYRKILFNYEDLKQEVIRMSTDVYFVSGVWCSLV